METRSSGEVRIVTLVPRFDAYSAKEVEGEISSIIDSGEVKLVCDFSQTDYISSAGLRVLLKAAKKLQRLNGNIALCSLKPYVKEVFEIAGFDSFLPIVSTMKDALNKI